MTSAVSNSASLPSALSILAVASIASALAIGWSIVDLPAPARPWTRTIRSGDDTIWIAAASRSEEHTSELQSLMRISYAVFCLKKKKKQQYNETHTYTLR